MNEYLKAQSKTNETVISGSFTTDELERFSKSDFRWANNQKKTFQFRTVKKGDVYQFEFGKNFVPEISYEHRGLVIGVKKKLLYVLPIFSYNPEKHLDVYHPIDYPASKSDLFLLKSQDFSFLTHDSVLKLNDIRTVSINRILYQHTGRMDLSSNTYKQIEALSLQKYFPEVCHELVKKETTIKTLTDDKKKLSDENTILSDEIKNLKEELNLLQTKLSKSE